MKIAIDTTTLHDQYAKRGIGNYTRNLLRELIQNSDHEWHLIGFLDEKSTFEQLDISPSDKSKLKHIQFHSLGQIQPSSISNIWKSKKIFLPILKEIQPDIVFTPNFERGIFRSDDKVKTVVMIHDVIPFITGKYSSKGWIQNKIKGWFYRKQLNKALKADLILTTSNFSKQEIIRYTGTNSSKINPVYSASSKNFTIFEPEKIKITYQNSILESYGIEKDFILYYGGIEPNKNVETLIRGFKKFSEPNLNTKLVIVSNKFKRKFSGKTISLDHQASKLNTLVEKLELKNKVIFTGFVDDKHLPILLHNAKIFCHLSKYEGFGLSVLEALTVGTPCLISDIPVYREIFEDAAIFTDPDNPAEISAKLAKIIENKELRSELSTKAFLKAGEFDWKKTAENTVAYLLEAKKIKSFKVENSKSCISFVIPFFFPFKGGAENYTLDIALQLAKSKPNKSIEILTSTITDTQPLQENYRGLNIIRAKTYIDLYYLRLYPRLLLNLIQSNSQIIHVQGFGFIWQDFCLILKRFFSRKKIKFINTPHGPFMARKNYSTFGKIAKKIFTKIQKIYLSWLYDEIIMVNPKQATWIHRDYGITLDKIKFLPIGIDVKHFEIDSNNAKNQIRESFDIEPNTTIVSFLGRFHKYKGIFDLLSATNNLKNKHNFILFLMGSDSGEISTMRKFIEKNNLNNMIKIVEKPTDGMRDSILEASEIFVFPSEWEAYGIAMLEAMAHKNALISTKTEGGLHLIQNGENGILYKYGNISHLEQAMEKLLIDSKLRSKMIYENEKKAKSLLWEKIWPDYLKLYENN